MTLPVRRVEPRDKPEWIRMRKALWPRSAGRHEREIDAYLAAADPDLATFVAERAQEGLAGFLEAGTRPYAEGCRSSPVGYIEGWWVDADLRRTGVGARLVAAAESWARSRGLTEMASDTDLVNEASQAAHRGIGYKEVERIVCFRKSLDAEDAE